VSVVPGGPPLRFWWKNQSHVVAHYCGPERIETGWWRGQDVHRDYYLVETTDGKRFWLFRTLGDERWFLQGMFG
jgi:protein ImuB